MSDWVGWTIANISVRGLGLVARLGLSVYMVRVFDMRDVGAFGLILGLVGMSPAVLGWGLNYFVSRHIVDRPLPEAMSQVRQRLKISVLTVFACAASTLVILDAGYGPTTSYVWQTLVLVCGECVLFDAQYLLIALRRPVTANVLLFIRSAAWVFPAMLVGWISPVYRTMPFLLGCWMAGVAAAFLALLLVFLIWRLPFRHVEAADTLWQKEWRDRGWLIYFNDVGVVALLYLDRYVVTHFLGLDAAGVFSTYWAMANGAYVLVSAGLLQPAMPTLISAARSTDRLELRRVIEVVLRRLLAADLLLSLLVFFVATRGVSYLGVHRLDGAHLLFVLMLVGTGVRLIADMSALVLYSQTQDVALAWTGIFGIGLTLLVAVVCTQTWGLIGAGISMLLTPSILLTVRLTVLRNVRPVLLPLGGLQ